MKRAAPALAIFLTTTGAVAGSGRHVGDAGKPTVTRSVQNPDGEWRVESSTTVGSCDAPIPGAFTIADHRISGASGARATSWGYVDETGQLIARFTGTGGRVVRLSGQLVGATGSGAWSSPTDLCGGIWRATRG